MMLRVSLNIILYLYICIKPDAGLYMQWVKKWENLYFFIPKKISKIVFLSKWENHFPILTNKYSF